MKKFFGKIKDNFAETFLAPDMSIHNKLSNLIICFTFLGTLGTLLISFFLSPGLPMIIAILVALVIIAFCLYLSAYLKKPTPAAMIIILLINVFVMPIIYFTSGGIHSGMVIWFIVGIIFPFLVLEGWLCWLMVAVSFITLGSSLLLEYYGFVRPNALEGMNWVMDVLQSMLFVSLIFGGIFKIQTIIYTKQNEVLLDKEKELIEAKEKAEEANAAKSDFLANMSHEIRTPINAIMGFNEIILRDSTDEEVIRNSKDIQAASNNLLSLINNILDFSKIESGKMEILCDNYSLSSVLNDCYNMTFLRAFNKGLEFKVINDPQTPENLYGDQFHIFQIISNLLTNAVKYTEKGKIELLVTFKRISDDQITLIASVTDTGVGISDEDINNLFQSFKRLDEKRNRTIEGTGLGLVITQRLVEQMGGEIRVTSKEGVGSTFTAVIPQTVTDDTVIGNFSSRYEEALNQTSEKYQEQFTAPDARILVVDDVRMNLVVVKGLLKTTQVQIDTALSGPEALELTDQYKYDIIFMDHMMPKMDGIEALHELKARKNRNLDTPVVVLTANAIKGAEEEYKKAGFDNYLSKPAHGVDLENMILYYLPASKLQKSPKK